MSKEYIERGALMEILENQGHADIDDVLNIPAADVVEVKHGRWIVDEADDGEVDGCPAFIEFHCPCCNEPYSLESGQYNWYYGDDIPLKFCHECGCKMDGGAEDG